ncbi:MAG: endolytic transglycosylase MltG, partial [Oscillospiraceae bacterium]|nr:endolytic transglycosylase MltG [Oscillospiraceae bacterium]
YNISKVAKALKDDGLIEYPWFFRLFCWVYKADTKISQGTFTLTTDMDYMALVRGMRSSGGAAVTVDVTVPEGYTVQQIISLLAEKGVSTEEELTETAANYNFEGYSFISNENLGNISRLEGYLFPDTYNFYVGGRPELAFNSMLSNFENKVYSNDDLTDAFAASLEAGYSLSDIVTIASLIERETDGSDRGKIASVIYNRLQNAGETSYLLQIDAALVYAAGRDITQADYTDLDSPYNLYKNTGLPPTPIANPGIASIQAALQPEETNYYFYFLNSEGKHVFNETLAKHNAALASAGG